MTLFIEGFAEPLKGLGPEARFIFEVLSANAVRSANDADGDGIEALAKQLRLSQKLVGKALDVLARSGAVVQQKSEPKGKGRPAISYALSADIVQTLRAQGSSYGIHAEHLERLFSHADIEVSVPSLQTDIKKARAKLTKLGRPAPPGARKRLSAYNRLLFASLLARADECGVVSGLGGPELRKLTGFDEARLKHRLQRLMDLGLIRRYVPGLSSSIFAKSKVSSTYYLNLNHPGFQLKGECTVMVHLAWNHGDKNHTHADDLRSDVFQYDRKPAYSDQVTPITVIRFLAGQRRRVYPVIQVMLYRYASFLLSRHWATLPDGYFEDISLYEMIKLDFRKPALKVAGEDSPAEQDRCEVEWVEIIRYFYTLAYDIAQAFRSRYAQATFLRFDSVQMSLIPVADDLGYRVITMVVRSPSKAAREFIWLEEEKPGAVSLRPEKSESEVDLRNRYDFGLLTRPKREPGKK
ncbi:hypothetical protein [Pseudomonas sp.]|uniref:hypothetical protein n=1 Tax=Pseudomonas sp. TaxID=306 RepID=UPI003264FA72